MLFISPCAKKSLYGLFLLFYSLPISPGEPEPEAKPASSASSQPIVIPHDEVGHHGGRFIELDTADRILSDAVVPRVNIYIVLFFDCMDVV